MNSHVCLLVLGVGGNVSQGILKALARSSLNVRVIGACISPLSAGLYMVDRSYLSPRATDPQFLDWLVTTCRKEGVNGILSGVEPVLQVLARNLDVIQRETGAVCLVSSPGCLELGQDKLLLCQWLERHSFNTPRFANLEDLEAVENLIDGCGFPLIAKPRSGRGGVGIVEINNREDLSLMVRKKRYLLQERLGHPDCEYTTGTFSDREGRVRGVITMRRDLEHGTTYRAEIGDFREVAEEARKVVTALHPLGPCNVQSRLVDGQSISFEVNVRFSGTVPMRAHAGFNDVEEAVRHYIIGEPARDLPKVTNGVCLRYWNEIYVAAEAVRELEQERTLNRPSSQEVQLEDFGMSK